MASTVIIVRRFFYAIIAVLLTWQAIVSLLSPPSYILPEPAESLTAILENRRHFAFHAVSTAFVATAGAVLGTTIGLVLGLTWAMLPFSRGAIEGVTVSARTLPVVAVAPIVSLWLGAGRIALIAATAFVCFFPVYASCVRGLSRADPSTIAIFRLNNATAIQQLLLLRVPSAAPTVLAAMPLMSTLAVLGALVAEFIGSDAGLGSLILRSLYRIDTADLYAANALAAVLGMTAYLVANALAYPFARYCRDVEVDTVIS